MGENNPHSDENPNMDAEADLRMRIAEAISAGGGVSAMVEKSGIPLGTLSKYAAKTSTASFANAVKIATAANVGLDEIAFGSSSLKAADRLRRLVERMSSGPNEGWLPREPNASAHDPDFIRLPMYHEVHASAGPGAVPVAEQANDVVAFGRRFLRDRGAVPEKCSIIWARGTSMEPTIPDGSILVVDHSQSTVEHGCIYVFNVSDRLLVKRARWRMDGKLDLVSDNTNEVHPVETFTPDTVEQLRVVGRLVYFCRAP